MCAQNFLLPPKVVILKTHPYPHQEISPRLRKEALVYDCLVIIAIAV